MAGESSHSGVLTSASAIGGSAGMLAAAVASPMSNSSACGFLMLAQPASKAQHSSRAEAARVIVVAIVIILFIACPASVGGRRKAVFSRPGTHAGTAEQDALRLLGQAVQGAVEHPQRAA